MIRSFFIVFISVQLISCASESNTKLYTLLSGEDTGITFENELKFDKEFNIYTYRNYYNGGGVAAGDINNDGLVDLYFTGNQTKNRLYLNKGNLKFEDISSSAGVQGDRAWSTGVSMVDVNGDGLLDIYVCNSGDIAGDNKQNELYINKGDLSFSEEAEAYGLADQGFSTHAAFFDYDKDGDLDVYLLNNSYQAIGSFNLMQDIRPERDSVGGDKLYRNDEGRFVDVSDQAGIYGSVIGFGLGVTVGDVNGDGWQDIFVSNDFFEKDYLYVNNQDGTFSESMESSMRSISAASMGADMADINNDLKPDIFVTDMLPEPDDRLKQVTTFESWDKYQYKLQNTYYHQFSRNMLHINNGDGTFSELGRLAGVEATDWSWGALIFDMDNDGLKDLFVANGIYQDITDLDYLNFIADDETKKRITSSGSVDYKALVDPIPIRPIPNYAYKNIGNLGFENKAEDWGLDQLVHSNGSVYADLDNDGDYEVIVSNVNEPIYVYRNNAEVVFPERNYLKIVLSGPKTNPFGIGAKVIVETKDQDQYFEQMPIRGFQSTVDHRINVGLGTNEQADKVTVIWPNGYVEEKSGVKANQELTFEFERASEEEKSSPGSASPALFEALDLPEGFEYEHEENQFVDFDRDRLTYHMRSNEGPASVIGDFNGDGLDDIYLGGAKDQAASILVQKPDGSFRSTNQRLLESDKASEDVMAVVGDLDGDDDIDIIIGTGGYEFPFQSPALKDKLYLNDGKGNFERVDQGIFRNNRQITGTMSLADIDGDSDLDLFVGARLRPFLFGTPADGFIYLNDGSANFSDVTSEVAPDLKQLGMITGSQWSDIDGDTDLDLILVGEWMPIMVMKNDQGKWTESDDAFSIPYHGWWNSLEAADIDGDGDMDFIAGNHGRNSRFKPSMDQPLKLLVNDFDKNGTVEHIYARYIDDKLYPYTLKHDLVMQMPSMKKNFLKFEDYNSKTVEEIFNPSQLKNVIEWTANWFETSILINNGQGQFTVQALPRRAQVSPVYAISAEDLNEDGMPDLLIGGNQYRAKPQVGIYDANHGIVLINKGSGRFEFVDHLSSGFSLEGEVRGIERLTISGKERVLVVRNNNSALLYAKRP